MSIILTFNTSLLFLTEDIGQGPFIKIRCFYPLFDEDVLVISMSGSDMYTWVSIVTVSTINDNSSQSYFFSYIIFSDPLHDHIH